MNQNSLNLCFMQSTNKVLTGLSNMAFFAHCVKSECNESDRQGLENVFLFMLVDFGCSLKQGPRKTFLKHALWASCKNMYPVPVQRLFSLAPKEFLTGMMSLFMIKVILQFIYHVSVKQAMYKIH